MIKHLSQTALTLFLAVLFGSAASQESWPNVYANDLSERLFAQGRAALIDDRPVEAERLLEEAIQVIKVNHGLHSTRQIPVLELLINSQLALDNWSRADEYIDYFEWLNSRNYQHNRNDIEAFLEGSLALSNLLLTASADPDNPRPVRFLVLSKNLDWRAVTAIESNLGAASPELIPWLYRIALNHYYQTTLIRRRFLTNYTYKTDDDELISGWTMPRRESMDISYRIGRELIERLAAIAVHNADSDPTVIAMGCLHQADWDWLFGRQKEAIRSYQQAYAKLLSAGVSAAGLNAFFTQATVLPVTDLRLRWDESNIPDPATPLKVRAFSPLYPGVQLPAGQKPEPESREQAKRVLVRFDLVAARLNGASAAPGKKPEAAARLHNLSLVHADPQQQFSVDEIEQEISLLHFRPGLRDGRPVELADVIMEYTLASESTLSTQSNRSAQP